MKSNGKINNKFINMNIAILIIGAAIVLLLYANVKNQDTIAGNQVKLAELLKQIIDKL
jgi:hypothetical protein